MTGFDIVVLLIMGVAAVGGFMRGFVQEVLSLCALAAAIIAIRLLHTDVSIILYDYLESGSGASVLAFVLLLLIPYWSVKLIAKWAGKASRASLLGPVDRVLGFGFGAVKGIILVVMGFSIIVLAYDTIWGPEGRPEWITEARTYRLVNAGSTELVQLIEERRRQMQAQEEEGAV